MGGLGIRHGGQRWGLGRGWEWALQPAAQECTTGCPRWLSQHQHVTPAPHECLGRHWRSAPAPAPVPTTNSPTTAAHTHHVDASVVTGVQLKHRLAEVWPQQLVRKAQDAGGLAGAGRALQAAIRQGGRGEEQVRGAVVAEAAAAMPCCSQGPAPTALLQAQADCIRGGFCWPAGPHPCAPTAANRPPPPSQQPDRRRNCGAPPG